jgi:DNA-binding transcriptional LysR family regulator
MHLKIRHLEVFSALMEAGSVSHAAARLNVTQPAVSVALATLEREVGFRLFNRAKGFFAPTPEAQLLYAEAERSLLALDRVRRRAAEIRDGATASLTVASNGAAAINLLPRLIAEMQRERPGLQIDLKVRSSRQIASLVSGLQVDIGLIDAPVPVAGLAAEIFRLPCVCILRGDDPLAAEAEIRPAMLADRPVIAITGDHFIDRRLDALMAEADASAVRRVSCSYFAIARNMVAAGAGVALVDRINGTLDLADGVVWRPFSPRIDFELAMIVAQGHAPHGTGQDLMARLRACLSGA